MTREQIDLFIEGGDPTTFLAALKSEEKNLGLCISIHEAFLGAVHTGIVSTAHGIPSTPSTPGREAQVAMAYGILGAVVFEVGGSQELTSELLMDAEVVGYFSGCGLWHPDALLCRSDISDDLGWFFLDGLENLYGSRRGTVWEIGHTRRKA